MVTTATVTSGHFRQILHTLRLLLSLLKSLIWAACAGTDCRKNGIKKKEKKIRVGLIGTRSSMAAGEPDEWLLYGNVWLLYGTSWLWVIARLSLSVDWGNCCLSQSGWRMVMQSARYWRRKGEALLSSLSTSLSTGKHALYYNVAHLVSSLDAIVQLLDNGTLISQSQDGKSMYLGMQTSVGLPVVPVLPSLTCLCSSRAKLK